MSFSFISLEYEVQFLYYSKQGCAALVDILKYMVKVKYSTNISLFKHHLEYNYWCLFFLNWILIVKKISLMQSVFKEFFENDITIAVF